MENNLREKHRQAHYDATDRNDKLMINFWDIDHTIHSLYEGRGSQKRILIILLEFGTITQRGLTEWLGIQPGSASEVIAKLEKSGLIVRTENPVDRRTTDITLTEQGRIKAEEAAQQRKAGHEQLFMCLAEDEKAALLTLLEQLNADWRERYKNMDDHSHDRHGHGKHRHHHEREGR